MTKPDEWITLEEACALTDRNKRTLRRWIAANLVRKWRPLRRVYLLKSDVLRVEATMDARMEAPTFTKRHAATGLHDGVSAVSP